MVWLWLKLRLRCARVYAWQSIGPAGNRLRLYTQQDRLPRRTLRPSYFVCFFLELVIGNWLYFSHWLWSLFKKAIGCIIVIMQSEDSNHSLTTAAPKRKPSLKRTTQWSDNPSSLNLMVRVDELQQAVDSLQKRLHSLESEWQEVLEHLCHQGDSTLSDTEVEDLN